MSSSVLAPRLTSLPKQAQLRWQQLPPCQTPGSTLHAPAEATAVDACHQQLLRLNKPLDNVPVMAPVTHTPGSSFENYKQRGSP